MSSLWIFCSWLFFIIVLVSSWKATRANRKIDCTIKNQISNLNNRMMKFDKLCPARESLESCSQCHSICQYNIRFVCLFDDELAHSCCYRFVLIFTIMVVCLWKDVVNNAYAWGCKSMRNENCVNKDKNVRVCVCQRDGCFSSAFTAFCSSIVYYVNSKLNGAQS